MEINTSLIFDQDKIMPYIEDLLNTSALLGVADGRLALDIVNDCGVYGKYLEYRKLLVKYSDGKPVITVKGGISNSVIEIAYVPYYLGIRFESCRINKFIVPWINRTETNKLFEDTKYISFLVAKNNYVKEAYMPLCEWVYLINEDLSFMKNLYLYNLEDTDFVLCQMGISRLAMIGVEKVISNKPFGIYQGTLYTELRNLMRTKKEIEWLYNLFSSIPRNKNLSTEVAKKLPERIKKKLAKQVENLIKTTGIEYQVGFEADVKELAGQPWK